MKLVWKGKMTPENTFVFPDLPQNAKPLFNPKSAWCVYLLIIPILALAYIAIQIRIPYVEGILFAKPALFAGLGLSVIFLIVHELLHALCCPKSATIYVYFSLGGISLIPTCKLKKGRYIFMVLLPTILLGIVPLAIWLCFPGMSVTMSSVLFAFSIGSLCMCIGDIYNAALAAVKMSKSSVLVTSEMNVYIF